MLLSDMCLVRAYPKGHQMRYRYSIVVMYLLSLYVCFVALRPKTTAMVMAGRSAHVKTLFLGKLEQAVNQYFVQMFSLVTDNNPSQMIQRKGGECH